MRLLYDALLLVAVVLAMISLILGLYIVFLNFDFGIIIGLFIPLVGVSMLFFWWAGKVRLRIKSRKEWDKFLPGE